MVPQYSTARPALQPRRYFFKHFMQWESLPGIVKLVHFKESSEGLLMFAYRGFTLIFRIWSWGNPNNFTIFILHFKLKVCCLELGRFWADQTLHGCMGTSTCSLLWWAQEMGPHSILVHWGLCEISKRFPIFKINSERGQCRWQDDYSYEVYCFKMLPIKG